jgi:hypothetical protein
MADTTKLLPERERLHIAAPFSIKARSGQNSYQEALEALATQEKITKSRVGWASTTETPA